MEVLSLPCVAGQWEFEDPIAKGAFSFWMCASCWFSLYISIMIYNSFCFSCRPQMMPPRSSRLFLFLLHALCILCSDHLYSWMFRKKRIWRTSWCLAFQIISLNYSCVWFFSFWFFCLHDLWGIDYGPTGQVSSWWHRSSNRLGPVHRFTKFRKNHHIILIINLF